jgi:transcriptional regulator with XRE-family HTH domain
MHPIPIARVVQAVLRRCGEDSGRRHPKTGEPYNLRRAESETGISRTALTKIAIGESQDPDNATYQKLARWLEKLDPPLSIDDQEIKPSWLELTEWNNLCRLEAPKPGGKESEKEREKTEITETILSLMERLKKL